MALLQCRACGLNQLTTWNGVLRCPTCKSADVRVAIAVEDMSKEVVELLRRSIATDDEGTIREGI